MDAKHRGLIKKPSRFLVIPLSLPSPLCWLCHCLAPRYSGVFVSGLLCAAVPITRSCVCAPSASLCNPPLCTSHLGAGGSLHITPAFPSLHQHLQLPGMPVDSEHYFASCPFESLTPLILHQPDPPHVQTPLCFHSYARFCLLPIKTQLPHLHPARAPLHLHLRLLCLSQLRCRWSREPGGLLVA